MIKVLQGLKVVEQGTFITGPAAGMLLGDLGADVIKVEQPLTGDPFRAFQGGLYSPHFQTYNRNKRSITLDTRDCGRPRGVRRPDRRGRCLHPELPPRRGAQARRRRGAPARAQPEADLLLDQRFRRHRPGREPACLRHRRASRQRLPQPAGQPAEPACRRPGHRRFADRLLRGLWRDGCAVRARPHRHGPHRRGLDAGGDGALQPRRLHALLPGQ